MYVKYSSHWEARASALRNVPEVRRNATAGRHLHYLVIYLSISRKKYSFNIKLEKFKNLPRPLFRPIDLSLFVKIFEIYYIWWASTFNDDIYVGLLISISFSLWVKTEISKRVSNITRWHFSKSDCLKRPAPPLKISKYYYKTNAKHEFYLLLAQLIYT